MPAPTDLWALNTEAKAQEFLAAAQPIHISNFVGNEFAPHKNSEDWIDSTNPRTAKTLVKVPRSGPEDVEVAVEAAAKAFPSWSKTSRKERSQLLQRVAGLISENKELFAVWESVDQGKTLARARIEIDRAIDNFK